MRTDPTVVRIMGRVASIPTVAVLLALAGCGAPDAATPETRPEDSGAGSAGAVGGSPFDPAPAMTSALQSEHGLAGTWTGVLDQLGEVTPFTNLLPAEQQHVTALSGLFAARELEVPGSTWDPATLPTFASRADACAAGVVAEAANVALYDELLALELPDDVRQVFTNLRAASDESTTISTDSPGRRERDRGHWEYIPSVVTGIPSTLSTESLGWNPASSRTLPGATYGLV